MPRGERFVDELAPRDEVSRAILARLQQTGAQAVGLDMRAIDPAHFPNVVSALREAGSGSDPRADPGRARGALHDGRDRQRPERELDARRPVRRRRVLLHGPARRQPAGVELAQRVLRVRSPRGVATLWRIRAARRRRRIRARSPSCARCPRSPQAGAATRAALWRDAGIARSAEGSDRAAGRCPSARPADRPQRARAHREPRSSAAPGPSPCWTIRSTTVTRSSAATSWRGRPGTERRSRPRSTRLYIKRSPVSLYLGPFGSRLCFIGRKV